MADRSSLMSIKGCWFFAGCYNIIKTIVRWKTGFYQMDDVADIVANNRATSSNQRDTGKYSWSAG